MKKILRRAVPLFLSVILVLSFAGSALAANPRIIFDNEYEPQPDLYVTKTVESAIEGYTIPDADFTFQLKWDRDGDGYLEFADSVRYTLLDESGTSLGTYRTDETGHFTLKAGQYAWFEFAGEIEYEVTEITPENFVQTIPAGGESATGTIPAEGIIVIFNNVYIPFIESELTELAIRKDVLWPDGYQAADIDSEFSFTVEIADEIYGNEPYTVYNTEDMTEEVDRGTTDADGSFSIQGGQTAVFTDIEVGVDYRVTENDTDGWQAVGTTEYHGSTTGPIVYAYFTNEPTWFTVSKERSDGAAGTDQEFNFILTSDGSTPMGGVTYYVYNAKGELVGETDADGETVTYARTTGSDGSFMLKADETALFAGLAEGTEYVICEQTTEGYVQVQPEMTADNTNGRVSGEASFDGDEYTFINEQLTYISIKKTDASGSKLLAGAEFTLYKLNDGYTADSTDDNAWTLVETKASSDQDGDGYGSLTFTGLASGTYKIVETKTPAGYAALENPIIVELPYTVLNETVTDGNLDPSGFVWSERDGLYYVYDLTYSVSNIATVVLPNTGSFPWIWVVIGAAVVILGGSTALMGRYIKKNSTGKRVAV